MIVCHRHRFIFIKTRKTAGSSIEIALSRLCGPGDIVTRLSSERGEERLRQEEGGYGPTGDRKPVLAHRGFREWRRLLTQGQRARWRQHTTARTLRELLPSHVWDSYLKITVERNPWDRALSRYWWMKGRREEQGQTDFPSVSEYLIWMEKNKPQWISNWAHYAIDDGLLVDRVLLYERLDSDLAELAQTLGVDATQLQLPEQKAKGGFRKDTRSYRDVLGQSDRTLIERVCQPEIRAFGYQF
ncbi:sulfotransferase family 2 domain-containing protein [Thioalkalivibrio sp. ALJ24]|uniref:sulfotransferase family 2 domain-containing protein n=1 Tax=Thioalkalivibrio sp. ALJ24 TaxID=545276 RepID=UPI0003658B7C|nr:sulfotransferase family 2 domain-containing protein [Thioalkalivibrio sp. ALJ24]